MTPSSGQLKSLRAAESCLAIWECTGPAAEHICIQLTNHDNTGDFQIKSLHFFSSLRVTDTSQLLNILWLSRAHVWNSWLAGQSQPTTTFYLAHQSTWRWDFNVTGRLIPYWHQKVKLLRWRAAGLCQKDWKRKNKKLLIFCCTMC